MATPSFAGGGVRTPGHRGGLIFYKTLPRLLEGVQKEMCGFVKRSFPYPTRVKVSVLEHRGGKESFAFQTPSRRGGYEARVPARVSVGTLRRFDFVRNVVSLTTTFFSVRKGTLTTTLR